MKRFLCVVIFFIHFASNPSFSYSQVYVYDNNNQYLGQLLSAQNMEIFNDIVNKLFIINPTTKTLSEHTLYYKTTNCSGQAYTIAYPNNFIFINTGNIYELESDVETFAPSSFYNNGCTTTQNMPWPYAKVKAFSEQLPFSLPIQKPIRYVSGGHPTSPKVVVIPLTSPCN